MTTVMIIFSCHIPHTCDAYYYNETYNHNKDLTKENVYRSWFFFILKKKVYTRQFFLEDVRSHFIDKKIPDDILVKILNPAHHVPSVGFSQPWDFILIKNKTTKLRVKESFTQEWEKSISLLDNDLDRQDKYVRLKLEGILESHINFVSHMILKDSGHLF